MNSTLQLREGMTILALYRPYVLLCNLDVVEVDLARAEELVKEREPAKKSSHG